MTRLLAIPLNRPRPLFYGLATALAVVAVNVTLYAMGRFEVMAAINSPSLPIIVLLGLQNMRHDSWLWFVISPLTWGLIVVAVAWLFGPRQSGRSGGADSGGG